MRCFFLLSIVFCMTGCLNTKSRDFKNYLIGDWRIENPTIQSFIRFEENGKTTYFFNRFSYKLDTLAEYGKWNFIGIRKGQHIDTFILEIDKQPQKTIFKLLAVEKNRLRVIDERGKTFFTRIKNNQNLN